MEKEGMELLPRWRREGIRERWIKGGREVSLGLGGLVLPALLSYPFIF